MSRTIKIKTCISLLLFSSVPIFSSGLEALRPVKINQPPIIDGKLDENIYNNALSVTNFKTFSPDFGKDGFGQTIAYAAYDSENLYFAFKCYDREPNKIKYTVNTRDNIGGDDWVCINLDSFNDQQSLYAFYVNPLGIQSDSRYAANIEDFSADFVWFSAGQILPDGYTVEISIPLKSIRYSSNDPTMMGIFFERYVTRLNEHSSFPELDPAKGAAFLTEMQPLAYYDLKQYTLFELLPAFTYSQKYSRTGNDLIRTENKGNVSLTAKYGINSDLVLDATYNPDFSQVESDAGQVDVNLRYSLFYSEKRPFFLEGNEIYNIAATQTSDVDPFITAVHTRTIVDPIAGIKLSGKIGAQNTLAALYAADELPADETSDYGDYAHFPILRYKRTLWNDSYVGGIYTSREMKNYFNRAGGLDGIFRLTDASTIEWHGLLSKTKSETDFLHSDVNGHAIGLDYNYNSRNLYTNITLKDISNNFDVETGYITRTGIFLFSGLVRPKMYPDNSVFQRTEFEVFTAFTQDKPSSLWETYNHVSFMAYLFDSYNAKFRFSYSTEIYLGKEFKTGGFYTSIGGQISKKFTFSLVYKRTNAVYYCDAPLQGVSNRFALYLVYQPIENLESFSTVVYSDFKLSPEGVMLYEYPIYRERLTYQVNKYLFFRGVVQYNKYKRQLLTDFLASFTYVPGTVMYLGYGSLYERTEWVPGEERYAETNSFNETTRGFFLKMSYLWRL